jgi:hypothetical protein
LLEKEAKRGRRDAGMDKIEGLVDRMRAAMQKPQAEDIGTDRAPRRNRVARAIWGFFGVYMILAACGLTIGGTLAAPDYESIWDGPECYSFNTFHMMYLGASALLCFGVCAIWKASHRGGLDAWRATIRPVLMSFCAACVGAGLCFALFAAPPRMQTVAMVFVGVASVGFMFLWYLRGTHVQFQPGDIYWNRTWMVLFFMIAVLSACGAAITGFSWADRNFEFRVQGPTYTEIEAPKYGYGNYYTDGQVKTVMHRLPVPVYRYDAIACALFAMLALGAVGEALYRRQYVVKALNVRPADAQGHEP